MGYPYNISKTSLSAVGSPHAWPQILGAIAWLVDLLIYDADAAACGGQKTGEFEATSDIARKGDVMFVEYLKNGYQAFLSGNDALYEDYTAQFRENLEEQSQSVAKILSVKEEEQNRLKEAIQAELHHGEQLPKLQDKLRGHESDHDKLSGYVEQLKAHNVSLKTKVDAKKEEAEVWHAKIEQVRETCKSLKAKIGSQELSADEALRMVTEKDRIERQLNETTAYHLAMKHKEWEAETELRRHKEELERALHSYVAKASEMQLLPPGSANAQGVDFRIELNKEMMDVATNDRHVLSTDVSGKIVPALNKYKEMISNKANGLRTSVNLLQDQEEQSQEALEEAQARLETVESKHSKLEEKVSRTKDQMDAILHEKQQEHAEIEADLERLKDDPVEKERRRAHVIRKLGELKSQLTLQVNHIYRNKPTQPHTYGTQLGFGHVPFFLSFFFIFFSP
jgi:kinetochore protein NDC80